MENILIEALGYLGILFNTISSLPQLIKTYRTKDVKSLSFSFIFCWAIGCASMTAYALLTGSALLNILNYGINVVLPLILLWMYWKYK